MPTRAVTVMCLIQVAMIVVCYLTAAANLRALEKALDPYTIQILQQTRWYTWMSGVRSFVYLMLLVPVGMAVWCARLTQTYRDMALLRGGGFGLAVTITAAVVIFTFMTVGSAFSGPGRLGPIAVFNP